MEEGADPEEQTKNDATNTRYIALAEKGSYFSEPA